MNTFTWKSPAGLIEASVLIAGSRLPLHRRHDGRPFAAGIPGSAYTIGVRNLTSSRIEVITTVDGRNVLRDEPGDAHASQGLVIRAHGAHEYPGWQFGDAEAGQFLFGDPSASIAAMATGSAAHVGVIGFAAHRERYAPPVSYPVMDSPLYGGVTARSATFGTVATASAGSLGTGIGERVSSPLGRTEFTRDGSSPDILVIGYDTEEALRERGIIVPADPQAFPGVPTGYERYSAS